MTSDARHARFSRRHDSGSGKLWSTLSAPPNFHDREPTLFQPFDLPIHDLHRFFHEVEFLVDLNFFQEKNKCLIRQTLIEV
ncbi:hypothetical protein LXL04_034009 [Taraxacum kok-saghyz]